MKEQFKNAVATNMMTIIRYTRDIDDQYIQKAIRDIQDLYHFNSDMNRIVNVTNRLNQSLMANTRLFNPTVLKEMKACIKNIHLAMAKGA